MANLYLTHKCKRGCPFCFARKVLKAADDVNEILTLEEIETFLDHFKDEMDWRTRKEDSLKRLRAATRDEKIVALGDKLSNMRAIARDYNSEGEVFWDRFRVKEKSVHGWRYHALLDAFAELSDTYAYQEFEFLVNRIFPAD